MQKRSRNLENPRKNRGSASSEFYDDDDVKVFKLVLKKLKSKYHLSSADIVNLAQEEMLIPSSIFNQKLSPLETNVKYMRENISLDYSKIADLLGRDRKTIWQAYKNAAKKYPAPFAPAETEYQIPVSAFRTSLSILESASVYLKVHFNLSYHKIGELLQRNERTIWTVCNRAQRKLHHAK